MELTKRQIQVGKLVHEELSQIFTKEGFFQMGKGMASIAEVIMTPDLLEAKVFLSFINVEDKNAAIELFEGRAKEIRGTLGNRLRHHLRRIPELHFLLDDSMERAFRLEKIFKDINKEQSEEDA